MEEKIKTLNNVSVIVCNVINGNIDRIKRCKNIKANPDMLFSGDKKPVNSVVFARSFCYYILHTLYGFSYTTISKITGRSKQGIISHVSKMAHIYIPDDPIYSELWGLIRNKI